jgi:iron complex outermembrane receptor protein
MVPQLGLVYLPTPNLSFYANGGRQFDIVDGLKVNQKPLAPEKTENNEIGFKWWPLETFNVTTTYFQLIKANYAAPGNDNGGFGNVQQVGEFTSTGREINMSGYILPHIKLSANYAKSHFENKAETGISTSLLNVLRGGVPEENGSFWIQYHNIPFGKQGWSIGSGVTYLGMRRYELQELFVRLDPILLLDASIAYRNDDFRLALNIDNITNKDWITGASSKVIGVPDAAQASTQISAFYLGHGYGTRVRLSTEMYF